MRPNFNEIAGINGGRDITRGWVDNYWGYLPTQDPILSLKSGGDLSLYEKVLEDYQVKSCLQQRFSKLTSKKVEVLPGGAKAIDEKAADAMLLQLKRLPWDAINKKMLMGVFYGYSLGEILWRPNGSLIDVAAIKVRNRRRFKFGVDFQPRLLTQKDPMGEQLPDQKFWYFCTGADNDDEPDGRGLGYWLYWLTWFKRNDIRWWITFLENFAEPSRVGKYPSGSTPEEKKTLENAVQMLGRHKWATMPEGMLYELIEASRSGTADYQAMVQTLDSAISKVIVGQTMTTDNGSSRSQSEIHEHVGDAVTAEDNDLISDSLQDFSRWWTEWNFPGAMPPIITRKMSEMDMNLEAEKDTKLQGLGISLKPEAIAAKYGDDYLVPDNENSVPQLSGEQVNALVSIISNAKQGGWSPELVAGVINGAFPNWPDEAVAAITDNLGSDAGLDPNNPQVPVPNSQAPEWAAQSLDAAAAQFARIPEGTIKGDKILHNSRWHLVDTKDLLEQHKDVYEFHMQNIPTLEDGKDLPPELVKSAAEYLTLHDAYVELYGDDEDKLFEKLTEVGDCFSKSFYDAVDDDLEDEEFDRVQNMLDTLMKTVGFSRFESKPISATAQFAKKKCVKGISCGDSCIAASKVCDRELDSESRAMVAALRKRIRSGDDDAAGKLDKFRQAQIDAKTKSNLDRLVDALDNIDFEAEFGVLEATATMREIQQDLYSTGMPLEQATQVVDGIKMPRLSKNFQDSDRSRVEESAVDFLRITNGVGSKKLNKFVRDGSRAYANFADGLINVGSAGRSQIFHEMGHFAEDEVAGSVQKNTDWVKSRATGEKQWLGSLTGRSTYGKTELAYPDNFYTPYVGKTYPNATEVISMGLEKFEYAIDMVSLYRKDKEHFKLIIDFLKEARNVRS